MTDSGDLLYQIVRFAFTGSLLLFLLLLLRATLREIDIATRDEAGAGAPRIAQLHVEDGAGSQFQPGDMIEINRRVVVGRSPECDIIADDPSVSTLHAALFSSTDHWFVEDFGSTNGTYVSGKPVVQTMAIESGETIQFGRIRMRLMC